MKNLLRSNRFTLIVIGIVFALAVLAIVAINPEAAEFAKWIVGVVEVLIGIGIDSDRRRRMGGDRP